MPEWMTTGTICHDEPKFYLNLVNFDVVAYVTHNVTVINDIKVKIWYWTNILTLYTCSCVVPIYILTWQFCVKWCIRHL